MGVFKGRFVTQGYSARHQALDLSYTLNEKIRSFTRGKVIARGWSNVGGKYVLVKSPDQYTHYYGHMNRFSLWRLVSKGVKKGSVIGGAGMTGLATGVHVHYQIRNPKGVLVDPRKYKY